MRWQVSKSLRCSGIEKEWCWCPLYGVYILPDMQWQLVIEYMTAELGGEYLCSVSSTIAICRYVHSRDVPNMLN